MPEYKGFVEKCTYRKSPFGSFLKRSQELPFLRLFVTVIIWRIIAVCGDFGGIWDSSNTEKYWLDWLEKKKFTILFVDGNHENFDLLNAFPVTEWNGGKVHVIRKNIIHLMRGQVFTIEGIRFFTFGGGQSHDIQAGILDRSDPDFSSQRKRLDRVHPNYSPYATSAFAFTCSMAFIIPRQTDISVKISTTLPWSVKGDSCSTDKSFITPLWTMYSTIWLTK